MQITELNEDCLNMVFGLLPFCDKIRVGLTCKCFADVFRNWIKKQNVNMADISKEFSIALAETIFYLFGVHMKRILYDHSATVYFDHISNYCPSLKEMHISVPLYVSKQTFRKFIDSSADLRILKIYMANNLSEEVSRLSRLEVLHINGSGLNGKYLSNLVTLVELNLENCWSIKSEHLVEILRSNKNLLKLNINGCLKYESDPFYCPIENQQKLEWLGVDSVSYNGFDLSMLISLKHIFFAAKGDQGIAEDFFRNLGMCHSFSLETLEIAGIKLKDAKKYFQNLSLLNVKRLAISGIYDVDDIFLRTLYNVCPYIEEFCIEGIKLANLMELVRRSKDLKCLCIDSVRKAETYQDIVNIRRDITKFKWPLTIRLYGIAVNTVKITNNYKDSQKIVKVTTDPEPKQNIFRFPAS